MADEGILNRDGGDFCWLTGDELTELVETNRVQWIWASLSGFPKEISLEEILSEPLPRADRESLWQTPLGIGHPMAEMEIVPFDSSLVILLSRERTVIDDFRRHFPLSEDLTAFMNRQKA